MKVKICNCSSILYWYRKEIGEIYEVKPFEDEELLYNKFYIVINHLILKYNLIEKRDCVMIEVANE